MLIRNKNKFLGIFVCLIFIIITVFSNNIFADTVDKSNSIFDGDYKSFFIGTIIDENNTKFKIKTDKIFIGENLEEIVVDKFNEYSYSDIPPKKGDIIVAILQDDNTLDLSWIFKSTSTNYKTLFLANDREPENEEVLLFQKLINSGEYIPNLEEVEKIKKKKEEKKENLKEGEENKVKTLSEIAEEDEKTFKQKMDSIYEVFKHPTTLIVPGIILIVIIYVIRSRNKFRKEVEERDDFI